MGAKADLTNRVFGKWTVIADSGERGISGGVRWLCVCECGARSLVLANTLLNGTSRCCKRCSHRKQTNTYMDLKFGITRVICSNGGVFRIDTADLPLVRQYQWWIDKKGYVKTKFMGKGILLSRLLMNITECGRELFVDHISGDTTDNRRSNLRVCLPEENIKNRKLNLTNKTGFKGVSFIDRIKKYRADIRAGDGKTIYLGCYGTVLEAATAYDRAAILLHGEFARTNVDLGLMGGSYDTCQAV